MAARLTTSADSTGSPRAYGVVSLKGLLPGLITMKPNTAAGFALAGTALYLIQRGTAGR